MFITLEGIEGSGKTTAAKGIIEGLKNKGYQVIYTREPGGNPIAESIRDIILDRTHTDMDARTEALLYAAARRQHLVDVINPALKSGKIVICDRFVDSSIAYQGHARAIGADLIDEINHFATGGTQPDLTFLIDVQPEVGLRRINQDKNREINRLDLEALEFHQAVYRGYHELAKKNPHRIQIINGDAPVATVVAKILNILGKRLSDERI